MRYKIVESSLGQDFSNDIELGNCSIPFNNIGM